MLDCFFFHVDRCRPADPARPGPGGVNRCAPVSTATTTTYHGASITCRHHRTDRPLLESTSIVFFFHSFAPARAKAGRYTRRHGDDDVPAGRLVAAASRVVVVVRPSVSDETCSPLHLIYSPRAACICVCTCASSPVLGYALGRTRLANNGVIR